MDAPLTFRSDALAQRNAVVTGGSRGIGRAVVEALARAGANVVVGYRSRADAARSLCEHACSGNVKLVPMQVDVARPDDAQRFVEEAESALGDLDILVNCAGVWPVARIWEMRQSQWAQTLAVNLSGTFHTCQAASRLMIHRRSGRIINFSSVAAVRGARSGHADYAAAKGGVSSLTRSLANELGPYGITVNAVAPGIVHTDMTYEALRDRGDDYLTQIPLGRIGTPAEMAGLVVFLASPAADYVSGQIIHVNGGMLMH